MNAAKKTLLVAGGLVASLLVAELILQLYSAVVPARLDPIARARAPLVWKDARLGLRPNPDYPDHDEDGYRNASVPPEAFVVAMGDSHTYGTGVRREENWPHRLQELTGKTVYNISCGGWGPTQNLLEVDRALARRPRLIVQAFYLGNDLFDCFETVYYDHQLPELATADPAAVQAIRAAEGAELLRRRYEHMYELVLGSVPGGAEIPGTSASRGTGFRAFLRNHSKLYQLASITRQFLSRRLEASGWEVEKREAQTGPGRSYNLVFESPGARTIFTPIYRSTALDLQDPRLAEGLRIALEAILRIHDRARKSGADFLVVLLPTKETAFRDLAAEALRDSPDYAWVIEREQAVRSQTMDFLRIHDIAVIDALPALRESLARGIQPYPESADGHPNAAGHRAIAGAVLEGLERLGTGSDRLRARTPDSLPREGHGPAR